MTKEKLASESEKETCYPTWRYHEKLKPEGLIVYDTAEEKALGAGWIDTPAKFKNLATADGLTDDKAEKTKAKSGKDK